jgi:hypothetical protein
MNLDSGEKLVSIARVSEEDIEEVDSDGDGDE